MSGQHEITTRFVEALKSGPFVMIGLDDTPDHSEPMTAQVGPDGNAATLWFFTTTDNRIAIGGPAMAQFASKGHDFFACLHGILTEDHDPATIDRLWSKQVEAWYPQGRHDPSILLLRYDIGSAEYWEAEVSLVGRVKMLFGANVRPSDKGRHEEVAL